MKTIKLLKAGTCTLLFLSTVRLLGIEGLQISVQCSNVVLSWPSMEGETYIVQYCATLDESSAWQTLTSSLPADLGTNLTFFVHSNVVQQPNCGGSYAAMTEEEDWLDPTAYALAQGVLMAIRADGSSSLVPLVLYPPGFDLSDFLIYDPAADEWFQGSASLSELVYAEGFDDLEGEGGQEDTGPPPETGFYRVVRNGLHLFGLTNGVALTGLVEFPIEVGADVSMQDIVLYADGENPAQSEVITNESGQVVLTWNTAFVPNGTYSIWIEGSEGFDQPAIRSATNSVTVENGVTFNEFTSTFGDQMWIYAVLETQNADYEIVLYDGVSGEYLGSFLDSTTNGEISFQWDLTDGQGYTFTNESFLAEFYIASGREAYHYQGSMILGKEYSAAGGDFLVARAENFNDNHAQAFDNYHPAVYNGAVNILGNPAQADPYTLSPGNIPLGDTTFQFTDQTKTSFVGYLTNMSYRHFFWWGHGSEVGIGYSTLDDEGNRTGRVGLFASEVRKLLKNGSTIRRHPYRLVFIHGCQAAKSRKWCNAFGIPKEAVSVAHFQLKGVRARAFVGNTGLADAITEEYQLAYAESLAAFFDRWMANFPVSDCLQAATNAPEWWETRIALPTNVESNAVWLIYGAQNLQRYGL